MPKGPKSKRAVTRHTREGRKTGKRIERSIERVTRAEGKHEVRENLHILKVLVARDASGKLVLPGDTVTDFRGDKSTFVRVSRLPVPGKSAKVEVIDVGAPANTTPHEFYAEVFDLTVTEE